MPRSKITGNTLELRKPQEVDGFQLTEPWIRIQLPANLGDFLLWLNSKEKHSVCGDGVHEVEKIVVF